MWVETSVRVALVPIACLLAVAPNAQGQMCIGHTTYVVRDSAGGVMDAAHVQALRISVNGVPLRLRSDGVDGPYFEHDVRSRWNGRDTTQAERAFGARNPLAVGGFCGGIGEVTLAYGGKVMRMLFDIFRHNTSFEIESPPFQDGTFHLRSLECDKGAPPPLIDNRTTGKCVVRADSWDGPNIEWVRHLAPPEPGWESSGGPVSISADSCRSRGQSAIADSAEFAAFWNAHPGVNHGNPIPVVDFRTQFVLAVFQADHGASYYLTSLQVDKGGNLTFVPAPDQSPNRPACSANTFVLHRSGINAVGGKPLPPAR